MKKIFALILCISLLCGFPTAFAETSDSSAEILTALNIGDFKNASDTLTRGAFIDAVSDILNYSNRPENTDGNFTDVTAESPYSGAIYDAHSRGLISGYADGTFGINGPILYEHAIKILVSALGYDNMAAVHGGYPSGYMIIADQNRLLRGITKKSGETLTVSEGARLIENAMNTPLYQQVIFGSDTAVFEAYQGETMLSIYAKIKKIDGKLTDNGITSLSGKSVTKAGNVIINSIVYGAGDTSADDYLGYAVKAYVTCKGDDNEKVLYISEAETVNILAIPASRILYSDPGFAVQNIIYEDVYGNVQQARVDGVADCIYNGSAYFDLIDTDLQLDFGKLILIDNNADSVYDVIKVEMSEIVLASGVDADKKTIYTKNGKPIKLENCKSIDVYRDGVESSLKDILEWDVVSVQMSRDKSAVTLNVSSQKLSGRIDAISNGDRTLSVDGRYYHVTEDALIDRMELGSSYEFCVDGDMNIAGIKSENQNSKYVGILVDAAQQKGINSKLQVKIFSSLGNFDVLDVSDRAVIEGDNSKTISQKESHILANMKYKLVSCKTNAVGEIIEINLPYSGKPELYQSEDDLRVDYDGGEKLSFYSPGNFAGKVACDSKAIVFLLPDDMSEIEDYAITTGAYFLHSTSYTISAYSIGSENGYSEYILYSSGTTGDGNDFVYTDPTMVVEKVTSKINKNGEIVDLLRGYNRSGSVAYETKNSGMLDGMAIKPGDIIRYKLNTYDKIIKLEKLIDGQSVTRVKEYGTIFGDSPRIALHDVYYRYGNILGYTKTDLSKNFDEKTVKAGLTVHVISTGAVVYEVDTENNNKITRRDYNAILPYTTVGVNRSRMFIHSQSGTLLYIVIYN